MQFFDLSTTVDPSYIISLIRKLLPLDSASRRSLSEVASHGTNQGEEERGAAPSSSVSSDENLKSSKNKSENMDVDVSGEISRGECQDTGDGIEHSSVSVGEDAWEELYSVAFFGPFKADHLACFDKCINSFK